MASTIENDLNPNTYVGLSFPLGHSGGGLFYRSKTLVEQARHNLKNLLLTNLGERAHQPEFGSRLLEVVFEFKDDALIEQVKQITKSGKIIGFTSLEVESLEKVAISSKFVGKLIMRRGGRDSSKVYVLNLSTFEIMSFKSKLYPSINH